MDHVGIANKYIADVLSGEVVACQYVVQACERQRADLARENFGFVFDNAKANRICLFMELLPHIKGEWAGTLIQLEPWQVFILTTVFGWVDANGYRRFKTIYSEIARKNAKSTISSGVALYCLGMEGEGAAEVYSAATTRDQARIVFDDASQMAKRSTGLKNQGYQVSAHSIYQESTASRMKALARDQGGNLDGLNVYAAIIDELHAHKVRDVWDVLETATGARRQPLIWAITTAGSNRAGICYEQRSYSAKLLNGSAIDEEYFAIIFTIDADDDWTDEAVWVKANPNLGVSVSRADITRKARKAMEMASAQNNFMTKHLNVWVNADSAWMNMQEWAKCAQPELVIDQFAGCTAWLGVDLASKIDIASVAALIEKDKKHYLFVFNFLNSDACETGRNSQYSGWDRTGDLIVTDGSVTDYAVIEDKIRELCSFLSVADVAFDPWQAARTIQTMQAEGLPVIEYGQTVKNMSEPMKTLEAMVLEQEIIHTDCPVLNWMMSNVVCHVDVKEHIYPRKEFPDNKIDGVVATIMAVGRMLVSVDDSGAFDEFINDPVVM